MKRERMQTQRAAPEGREVQINVTSLLAKPCKLGQRKDDMVCVVRAGCHYPIRRVDFRRVSDGLTATAT